MSYYPRGRGGADDDADDFDEYDPTPYGGGYDQSLTYGRPIPPSHETCYPPSSSSSSTGDHFDSSRPSYTSSAQPSAYADDALDNEYKSYSRPAARPAPAYSGGPGFQPHLPTPGGYGGRQDEFQDAPSSFGGGRPGAAGGATGYGRKSDYDDNPGYGPGGAGYDDAPSSDYGTGAVYGRKHEKNEYDAPSEYGRKNEYDAPPPSSEYGGSRYGRNNEYGEKPKYGRKSDDDDEDKPRYGSSYGRKNDDEDEDKPRYGSSYGRKNDDDDEDKPRYGSSYGRKSDDDDDKPRYGGGDEGYGRKKYGGDDSDDDDDEKKKKHNKHHHRKHYDD